MKKLILILLLLMGGCKVVHPLGEIADSIHKALPHAQVYHDPQHSGYLVVVDSVNKKVYYVYTNGLGPNSINRIHMLKEIK